MSRGIPQAEAQACALLRSLGYKVRRSRRLGLVGLHVTDPAGHSQWLTGDDLSDCASRALQRTRTST